MSGAWDETRACVNIWTCVLNILILRLAARARMMSYPLCQPESRYKSRVKSETGVKSNDGLPRDCVALASSSANDLQKYVNFEGKQKAATFCLKVILLMA